LRVNSAVPLGEWIGESRDVRLLIRDESGKMKE
jgi:hypothetical protein